MARALEPGARIEVGEWIQGPDGRLDMDHVSLSTTNIYAEIDLEMKAKALAKCEVTEERQKQKRWRDQPSLMEFLRTL